MNEFLYYLSTPSEDGNLHLFQQLSRTRQGILTRISMAPGWKVDYGVRTSSSVAPDVIVFSKRQEEAFPGMPRRRMFDLLTMPCCVPAWWIDFQALV